jgi:serine/threonine protein kinase
VRGEKYDAKVDVWSLGVMVMEMCSGIYPYSDKDPSEVRILLLLLSSFFFVCVFWLLLSLSFFVFLVVGPQ